MKRIVIGTVAALVSMALLTGVMLPLRDHLSIATTALVLVVPVVIGVVIGGGGGRGVGGHRGGHRRVRGRRDRRDRGVPGLRFLLHPALPDLVGRAQRELGRAGGLRGR